MAKNLTTDMLATALQRLEALQAGEAPTLESEQLKQTAEEVAEAALQAIAVCVKYMLASNGQSTIDGLGTFSLHAGHIQFIPENDVLQYALLKHQNEMSQQEVLREAFVKNLTLACGILPMVEWIDDEMEVNGRLEFVADDRTLEAIFGQSLPSRFDEVATRLLSFIIRHLRSVGLRIHLPSNDTSFEEDRASLSRMADEGRAYAQRKARELRQRAEDLIERGKELADRERDLHTAATEYEKRRIVEESNG